MHHGRDACVIIPVQRVSECDEPSVGEPVPFRSCRTVQILHVIVSVFPAIVTGAARGRELKYDGLRDAAARVWTVDLCGYRVTEIVGAAISTLLLAFHIPEHSSKVAPDNQGVNISAQAQVKS